ncbi:MAG: DUF4886 domain-containing protein [Thermoguttaceae bacterium]
MKSRAIVVLQLLVLVALLPAGRSAALAQAPAAPAMREIKVLGIGNSFTVNAFNGLRPMGEQSRKCRLTLGGAIIGGCSMEKHMRLAKLHEADPDNPEGKPYSLAVADASGKTQRTSVGLREYLTADRWDVVTIQQVSAQSPDVESFRPYAKELYDYIKKYAPQAEVVMHQTWAYRVDGDFDKVFPGKSGYGQADMYRDLDLAYRTIGGELGIRLIPVGAAFQLAREIRPFVPDKTVDLSALTPPQLPNQKNSLCAGYSWSSAEPRQLRCDSHHAGPQGEYLAGAVWFEFLTGSNPFAEGIPAGKIADEDARFLSRVAHQVVAEGKRPAMNPVKP